MLQTGQMVGDRFRVLGVTARGGMSAIYQGTDIETGQAVAIKVLTSFSEQALARFKREGEVLGSLSHPNIVRILGIGALPQGPHYIVEEWLSGTTLADAMSQPGLTMTQSIDMGRQVASALAEVHRHGIVHRDIKPSNIVLADGRWTLVDFGVAHLQAEPGLLTRTGMMIGTIGYMAPEQARGDKVITPAVDVFSLGCVLYLALTGSQPFGGGTLMSVQVKILTIDPPALRSMRGHVPEPLSELLDAMLAKDPEERPGDAAEVESALARIQPPPEPPAVSAPGDDADTVLLPPNQLAPRELTCVVMSAPVVIGGAGDESWRDEIRNALSPLGSMPAILREGNVVYAAPRRGSPTERADNAARAALRLRAAWPDVAVAIASGWNVQELASTIDAAAAAVESSTIASLFSELSGADVRRPGIAIDTLTAAFLSDQFEVENGEPYAWLVGERHGY